MTVSSVETEARMAARDDSGVGTSVAPETFKRLAGSFLTGVGVVTARFGDEDFGCTVSSVASVSLDPPLLLVCLTPDSATLRAIRFDGEFALAFLDDSEDSRVAAMKFAMPGEHPFADIEVDRYDGGLAVPATWLARARLRLWESHPGGDHEIVIGRVVDGEAIDGEPLGYWRSRFMSQADNG